MSGANGPNGANIAEGANGTNGANIAEGADRTDGSKGAKSPDCTALQLWRAAPCVDDESVRRLWQVRQLWRAAQRGDDEQVRRYLVPDLRLLPSTQRLDWQRIYLDAAWIACVNNHVPVVQTLLENGALSANAVHMGNPPSFQWTTLLQICCRHGSLDVATELLARKAFVTTREHVLPIFEATKGGHAAVVRLLVRARASVNNKGGLAFRDSQTPLLVAVAGGDVKMVHCLLQLKAFTSVFGSAAGTPACTPVEVATSCHNEHALQLLLRAKAGANSDAPFLEGPLHCALRSACTSRGREPDTQGCRELGAQGCRELDTRGCRELDTRGCRVVRALLQAKANVNGTSVRTGQSPLCVACIGSTGLHACAAHADLLLRCKADPDFAGVSLQNGRTFVPPLIMLMHAAHGAFKSGERARLTELLVAANASVVHAADWKGRSALQLAQRKDHKQCARILLAHMASSAAGEPANPAAAAEQ